MTGKTRGATRERIVEEAFTLFAERGYHAVPVKDIAEAVGIKDASLYNHFPSKQALFDAIIERELTRARDAFALQGVMFLETDDPSGYDPGDPEELARHVLGSYRYFFEDESMVRLRRLLVVSQFHSDEARRAYRLIFVEQPLALQRVVFEHCMATGSFARDDAAQMALEFHGPVFLMLHAGMTWDEAEARLAVHVKRFTARHRVHGDADAGASPKEDSKALETLIASPDVKREGNPL